MITNEYNKANELALQHYNDCLANGDFDDSQEMARIKENGASSFECTYHIAQINDSYISIAFHHSGYCHGNAQPFFAHYTFNYDIKKKKKIDLKDLFESDYCYLEKISKVCRAHLVDEEQDMGIGFWENDWQTQPKEENFTSFTFSNDHISFYFDWPWYHLGELKINKDELVENKSIFQSSKKRSYATPELNCLLLINKNFCAVGNHHYFLLKYIFIPTQR
ncbi:MAG: hypothetical protein ACOYT8_04985 [Candidatus Dependentiae bacterium]